MLFLRPLLSTFFEFPLVGDSLLFKAIPNHFESMRPALHPDSNLFPFRGFNGGTLVIIAVADIIITSVVVSIVIVAIAVAAIVIAIATIVLSITVVVVSMAIAITEIAITKIVIAVTVAVAIVIAVALALALADNTEPETGEIYASYLFANNVDSILQGLFKDAFLWSWLGWCLLIRLLYILEI